MKYYNISGPVVMSNVAEPTARRLKEIFARDGDELVLTFYQNISDRPLYRQPTEDEIIEGKHFRGQYVQTTAEDGIM